MNAFLVVIAIGVGSYALRAVMLVLVTTRPIPAGLESALALVGPAAVAALLATMVLTQGGQIDPLPPASVAATAAGFVAVRRTGNVMHAFTAGLPLMWVLTALGV
jgi:branched-subunit amino acid transport protein